MIGITMRGLIAFVLIGFTLSVDVCVDYSGSNWCTQYASQPCTNPTVAKYCPVSCGTCTQPPPTPNAVSLKNDCLAAFNAKRRLHQQTPDLAWDGVSEAQAQAVVDAIPAGGSLSFGNNNFYGRAGFTFTTSGSLPSKASLCQQAVDRWYSAGANYDYSNPRNGGSFGQLVWKSSTKLGVGIAFQNFGGYNYAYIIAHFYVAGNNGDNANNVMPLQSGGVVTTTTTTTSTASTASTASTVSTAPANSGYCLSIHNQKRALHQDTDPLEYDSTIAATAQTYATYMAVNDVWQHDPNNNYGENLYYYSGPARSDAVECEAATNAWYNEYSFYKYNDTDFSDATGHFTQVVWRNSKHLGVGIARSGNKVYVVARYDPPGNYQNEFFDNVKPLI